MKPQGEMTEKNLLIIAQIFWHDGDWSSQKRYQYDPENKRRFYQTDCASEKMKIIWEYEGPAHYENVWKLKRDDEREKYFTENGYKFIRWPYYLQLTKDVAKYFFGKAFSEDKYFKAIKEVYKVDKPEFILSPGFHQSKNTPANYVANGVRRFMKELDELPSSAKAQLAEGLRRYIEDVGDKYLVIGEQKEFEELLKTPITKNELNIYYHRKK
ncbi:DUF559 domain-containing protein [Alphaproteobacteria bacterium]|nr:DUF559 domain-containing protein [Alphaproteobacteria bacterium]